MVHLEGDISNYLPERLIYDTIIWGSILSVSFTYWGNKRTICSKFRPIYSQFSLKVQLKIIWTGVLLTGLFSKLFLKVLFIKDKAALLITYLKFFVVKILYPTIKIYLWKICSFCTYTICLSSTKRYSHNTFTCKITLQEFVTSAHRVFGQNPIETFPKTRTLTQMVKTQHMHLVFQENLPPILCTSNVVNVCNKFVRISFQNYKQTETSHIDPKFYHLNVHHHGHHTLINSKKSFHLQCSFGDKTKLQSL